MRQDDRYRSYSRRTERHTPGDVVFSTLLAQITICIVLLVLAYCLKLSGLSAYEMVRTAVADGLTREMQIPALTTMLEQFDLHIPTAVPNEPQSDNALIPNIETADASPTEHAMPVPPQDDEMLLIQGKAEDTLHIENLNEIPLGMGGGITPVSFSVSSVNQTRLVAPDGTFLSPFYIPMQPILPVKLGSLTSKFGFRTHPITGKPDFHTGVDVAAPKGTSIGAVLAGTVSEVGVSEFYGNYVVLRHGSNLETLYGHCSEVLVPVGTIVRQYETIARVGSTGMSTGNHVHLEFIVGGQKGNPAWVYDEL